MSNRESSAGNYSTGSCKGRGTHEQQVREKTSGLREAKRRSAADAQLKCMERCETGLALQAGLACSTDLRCVGVLPWHSCAFLVVSSVASEDSC